MVRGSTIISRSAYSGQNDSNQTSLGLRSALIAATTLSFEKLSVQTDFEFGGFTQQTQSYSTRLAIADNAPQCSLEDLVDNPDINSDTVLQSEHFSAFVTKNEDNDVSYWSQHVLEAPYLTDAVLMIMVMGVKRAADESNQEDEEAYDVSEE